MELLFALVVILLIGLIVIVTILEERDKRCRGVMVVACPYCNWPTEIAVSRDRAFQCCNCGGWVR